MSDLLFLLTMLGASVGAGVLGAILGLGGGILLVPSPSPTPRSRRFARSASSCRNH